MLKLRAWFHKRKERKAAARSNVAQVITQSSPQEAHKAQEGAQEEAHEGRQEGAREASTADLPLPPKNVTVSLGEFRERDWEVALLAAKAADLEEANDSNGQAIITSSPDVSNAKTETESLKKSNEQLTSQNKMYTEVNHKYTQPRSNINNSPSKGTRAAIVAPGTSAAPRRRLSVLDLPPPVLVSIALRLDYIDCVSFKLCSKRVHGTVPMPPGQISGMSKLTLLQKVVPSPIYVYPGHRAPLHLCRDCLLWHSFEHMQIYPHPLPESGFMSYSDYAIQKPRVCRRYAMTTGEWVPGKALDSSHILCDKCHTPRHVRKGRCTWNCSSCGRCTGRKDWSAKCSACWTSSDGPLLKRHYSSPLVWAEPMICPTPRSMTLGATQRIGNVLAGPRSRHCGRCLGLLSDYEGSPNLCRCFDI